MKVKGLYIVPMIGLGWFDQELSVQDTYKLRTILFLCFKLELYKKA